MGEVEQATHDEIAAMRVEDAAPGLIAVAIKLARSMDETDAPTAAAVVARELRALMADLRRLAPVGEEGDSVDDIARQREKRRADALNQQSG